MNNEQPHDTNATSSDAQTEATETPQPQNQPQQQKELNRTDQIKRSFFQILIGCLIGSAGIAVVAVLVGSFSDTLGRALGTIAMVALHAIFGFSYISSTDNKDKKDGGRSIELFSNTVFALIAISFITSVFAIWELMSGELTLRLYGEYFILLFATLHADILYRIRGFEKRMDTLIEVNYVIMTIVVALLSVLIIIPETTSLGDLYYRLLAAIGIIDATMTLTIAIMQKLFLQKHPQAETESSSENAIRSRNFWKNPLVVLLFIYLFFQVVGGLFALIVNSSR